MYSFLWGASAAIHETHWAIGWRDFRLIFDWKITAIGADHYFVGVEAARYKAMLDVLGCNKVSIGELNLLNNFVLISAFK